MEGKNVTRVFFIAVKLTITSLALIVKNNGAIVVNFIFIFTSLPFKENDHYINQSNASH